MEAMKPVYGSIDLLKKINPDITLENVEMSDNDDTTLELLKN